ncbi:flagellar hook assembly protein FlgD [Oricola thermophila]|uniref:Basal-body rod modification protein FlgD n=1 Tax=Oricola thermophila TaxID=2742145 RepID=A0A6N1VJM8_9HYPH|nr:flagellar hook assembly protein FlgD [Oricola thermophila]QKV19622.1 flagellar hook assembly protein FlgD [Oricola thermophila]
MTEVTSTTSSTYAAAAQSTATASMAKANVDYESFLRLLVAELKNQDPTEPVDSTEYIAQLASFSSVEQSIQTNAKLDDLIQMGYLQQAGSIIGRTLTSPDGDVTGVIDEVRVFDDGIVAVLEGGEQVVVSGGVTIS